MKYWNDYPRTVRTKIFDMLNIVCLSEAPSLLVIKIMRKHIECVLGIDPGLAFTVYLINHIRVQKMSVSHAWDHAIVATDKAKNAQPTRLKE